MSQNPLTPPNCDLKDFPFTPIFRSRLFGSEFHANATDAEWRAGVTLWLKSWDQVPAGSLPTEDVALCRLAEFGRDMKGWLKVKARALHGWVECSDGRMYHKVVAEGVLEAWERRRKATIKGKAGAEKRWGTGNATATENECPNHDEFEAWAVAQAMPGDSKGQGQGQGQGQRKSISAVPASKHISKNPLNGHQSEFDAFYAIFPKHVAKAAAGKAFVKALKRAPPEQILAGAQRYAAARAGEDAQFTKNPATWLGADCWLDEGASTGPSINPFVQQMEALAEEEKRQKRGETSS